MLVGQGTYVYDPQFCASDILTCESDSPRRPAVSAPVVRLLVADCNRRVGDFKFEQSTRRDSVSDFVIYRDGVSCAVNIGEGDLASDTRITERATETNPWFDWRNPLQNVDGNKRRWRIILWGSSWQFTELWFFETQCSNRGRSEE
jgi:hypothetical protein